MPDCYLPLAPPDHGDHFPGEDTRKITVGSCPECDSMNGYCAEGGRGGVPSIRFCFVRNVLTRALGDLLVDIGSTDAISASAIAGVDLTRRDRVDTTGSPDLRQMTQDLRDDLARQITGGILQLALTYETTVRFRDNVLLTTDRGRELNSYYDAHLGEMYRVCTMDIALLHAAATTWLDLHPFVEAVVNAAGRGDHANEQLTTERYERCRELFQRFGDASRNAGFREVLKELERDLADYENLTAREALEKLRQAPTSGATAQ